MVLHDANSQFLLASYKYHIARGLIVTVSFHFLLFLFCVPRSFLFANPRSLESVKRNKTKREVGVYRLLIGFFAFAVRRMRFPLNLAP